MATARKTILFDQNNETDPERSEQLPNVPRETIGESGSESIAPAGDLAEESSVIDAQIAEIRAQLGEMGEEPQIQVWRVNATAKREFCDAYPVSEFTDQTSLLKRIREEWGPGRYRVTLYVRGSYRFNRDCYVAATPAGGRGARRDIEVLGQRIEQVAAESSAQVERAIAAMTAALAKPAAPPFNPQEQMQTMVGMFKLAVDLTRGAAPAGKSIVEQMGELSTVLDAAGKLRDMAAPREVDDNPLLSMAPKFLDVLGGAFSAQRAAAAATLPPVALPATVAAPAGAPALAANEDQTVARQQLSAEQIEVVNALGMVTMMCRFGVSPEDAAEKIYEQLPEDFEQVLSQPGWFEGLSQIAPDIKPHEAWYRKTAEAVLKIIAEEAAPEPAPAAPAAPPKAA
jgi:hypothetical protein